MIFESETHSYSTGGVYEVTLTVTDASGLMSVCHESVTVFGSDPCSGLTVSYSVASDGYTTTVPVNNPVLFTDQTAGGTLPYSYVWNFYPDPVTGVQPSMSSSTTAGPHLVLFPAAGNYNVSLHICDQNGCGMTFTKTIAAYHPQHCLVTKINKMDNAKMVSPIGTCDFWDFTFTPWCGACQDPPGTSNFPCETNNYWKLIKLPGNQLVAQKSGTPFQDPGCTISNSLDQLFQYQFSVEGEYELHLKAWDSDCNVGIGYDCMNETSMFIQVIDCQQHKYVNQGNLVIGQGTNNVVYGGIIEAAGQGGLTVPGGAGISFQASQEVWLKDGFTAQESSSFRAFIEPCQNGTTDFSKQDQNNETEQDWNIYPNPADALMTIGFTAIPAETNSLRLLNLLGQCLLEIKNISETQLTVDVKDYPSGIYLFTYWEEGRQLVSKIIINKSGVNR